MIFAVISDWAVLPKDKLDVERQINSAQAQIAKLERELSQRERQVAELTQQLQQAKVALAQSEGAKPGRFQVINRGARTRRLDTATGSMCLLLASETDWKKLDVASQACGQ